MYNLRIDEPEKTQTISAKSPKAIKVLNFRPGPQNPKPHPQKPLNPKSGTGEGAADHKHWGLGSLGTWGLWQLLPWTRRDSVPAGGLRVFQTKGSKGVFGPFRSLLQRLPNSFPMLCRAQPPKGWPTLENGFPNVLKGLLASWNLCRQEGWTPQRRSSCGGLPKQPLPVSIAGLLFS